MALKKQPINNEVKQMWKYNYTPSSDDIMHYGVIGMKWMESDMKTEQAFEKKQDEIMKKHLDEFAGATLKDLGYEDTKQGREYLKKMGIISA